MSGGIGPKGQGIEDIVARVDAANLRSYTGTGNTINSTLGTQTFQSSGVTFISNKGESVFVFASSGFVTSRTTTGVSGPQSRTMSAWVKPGKKASQGIMSAGANGAGTGMALATSSTVWLMGYGSSGSATTITYNPHQWYFLTYVSELISGSTHRLKFYVNGGLAHTSIVTSINLTNSTLRIGCDNSGFGFSGQIARTNFYKKALTDSEIRKSYWNYKSRYGL